MATPVRIEKMPKRQKHSLEKRDELLRLYIHGADNFRLPVDVYSRYNPVRHLFFSKISDIAGEDAQLEFIGWETIRRSFRRMTENLFPRLSVRRWDFCLTFLSFLSLRSSSQRFCQPEFQRQNPRPCYFLHSGYHVKRRYRIF